MTQIPLLKFVPHTGSKIIRRVPTDWPHCRDHETVPLIRRHPNSVYLWCSGGHHFVTQSSAMVKRVMAYEVEEYPR